MRSKLKGCVLKIHFVLAVCFFAAMTGCAPKVNRMGYTVKTDTTDPNCFIVFKYHEVFDPHETHNLGAVEVGDTGFSTNCDESDVLAILKREGCALGANIVNIVNERRADMISSCYRVTAEFIQLRSSAIQYAVESDSMYTEESISQREKKDNKTKRVAIGLGIAAGVIGGLIAGLTTAM